MSQINFIIDYLKNYQLGANSGYDYLMAFFIFLGLLVVLKLFQVIILARLKALAKKTKTNLDDLAIDIFTKIKPPLYLFIAIFFSIKSLVISGLVNQIINILLLIVIVYEIIKALEKIVDYFISKQINKIQSSTEEKKQSLAMLKALKVIVRMILWIFGLILILSNLGIDITSLIAGLGIGGIAIALALQNILGDIFSSFSIYLDKPFQIGDFVVVGTNKGTIEKIGLKTTRLRSLQGEELIISNKELTSARVQNYKRMERRRESFNLGVTYETKQEKLEKIPSIIKQIVSKYKSAEFDRCHFVTYGDFSLIFEIVYFVDIVDYSEFLDIKQKINLEIFKKFQDEKIEFAYPTQTVIVNK